MERLAKIESMVGKDIKNIKNDPMTPIEDNSYSNALSLIKQLPIMINDSANVTENDIRAAVTQCSVDHEIKLVVVDYIQKIASSTKNIQLNEQVAKSA
jgi:replicative DNA helicase